MTPRFTVVLTTYNRPKLATDAIWSVRNQTLQEWELLVADDDSNEETVSAIEKAAEGDDRVRLIKQAAGRPSMEERRFTTRYCATINRALTEARGDLIAYVCDDDVLYPNSLKVRLEAFDTNPDIHVVYGRLRSITYDKESNWDSNGKPRPGGLTFPEYGETDPETGKLVNPATWNAGLMTTIAGHLDHNQVSHRKVCLEEMGGPPFWPVIDSRVWVGDAAFFQRLDNLGHEALSVNAMVVTKRYHVFSAGKATSEVRE